MVLPIFGVLRNKELTSNAEIVQNTQGMHKIKALLFVLLNEPVDSKLRESMEELILFVRLNSRKPTPKRS